MIKSSLPQDCGICSVANALDISWKEAHDRIYPFLHRKDFRTTTRCISRGLNLTNHYLRRVSEWNDIPDRSIVKLARQKGRNWHWVVWRDNTVWDSESCWPMDLSLWELLSEGLILRSYLTTR